MITTMKTLVGLSALLSVGLVTCLNYIDPPVAAAAMAKMAERHPGMGGPETPARVTTLAYRTVSTKKGDRLKPGNCAGETWPYIPSECRTAADGGTVRHATRTITIEQRVGENTSLLLRLPAQVAQR